MQLLPDLSKYKCAIFDCDGVILQSNEIKTNAFLESLKCEPANLVDQFISYHKSNGGISRYVKFKHYYRNIKREKYYTRMTEEAILRYSKIVIEKLMLADYVPGVMDAVNYFNDRNIPCFVVSGGDQSELHKVFLQRKINDNFIEILGSPVTKKQHILEMKKSNKLKFPGIFFGDSYTDMEAADIAGFDFIFIYGCSEWNDGIGISIKRKLPSYKDFTELFNSA
jgi:phosphoglycolate phosphatase-like HAD superfamily hydrolase